MQTVLGAGGPIGRALATALRAYTNEVRLVNRKPEKINPGDELFPADLLVLSQVEKAVKGAEVVYLTAGLDYKLKTWEKDWPKIASNVIEACIDSGSKLVFFDNVYMYDRKSIGRMNERTPVIPPSRKGLVRAQISEMIMKEVWTGKLEAMIARSADFYGPGIKSNSLLIEMVFKPLSRGNKALWLGAANKPHSFTYVPDAARATALLGNSEEAYGQVWHLPTAKDAFTGRQWVDAVAKEFNVKPTMWTIPKRVVKVMGIFMPVMKETVEMMYQYENDYIFDSSKIEEQFKIKPTPCKQGIKDIVAADFSVKK